MELLKKALQKLQEALDYQSVGNQSLDLMVRDSAIKRFEFTIELFWKTLQKILRTEGVVVNYPKEVLQAAFQGSLINHEKIWVAMLQDRNELCHIYQEEAALEVFKHLPEYLSEMRATFQTLENKYIV